MKSVKAKQATTKRQQTKKPQDMMESKHYHLGKADAFEGRVNCKAERGSPEHMDYFRGFREGLSEAYGSIDGIGESTDVAPMAPDAGTMTPASPQMTTSSPGSTTPGSTTKTVPTAMSGTSMEETMFLNDDMTSEIDRVLDDVLGQERREGDTSDIDLDSEDDLDEVSKGEWIKQQDRKAEAAGKSSFKAFGQKFNTADVNEEQDFFSIMETAIKRDSIMNSWNQQLTALLTEAKDCDVCGMNKCECDHDEHDKKDSKMKKKVSEGMTVTTTTGSQYGPDSININATDEDAHELMRILKHSGISVGLGDDDDHGSDFEHEGDDSWDCDDAKASDDDVVDGYEDVPAMSMPRGMMMSTQAKPESSSMKLQPKDAVDFHDVIDAFGGRMSIGEAKELVEWLRLSGRDVMEAGDHPKGKGMSTKPTEHAEEPEVVTPKQAMKGVKPTKEKVVEGNMEMPDGKGMSKNVKDKPVKPPKPTDQSAIMNTLKPEGSKKNGSLEGLQKSHDAGPAGKEDGKTTNTESPNKPKAPPASEKHDFENASLSENIAHDLYKLYTISEDASQTDTMTGYKYVDAMAMPRGMGMSVNVEDEPQKRIEPTDHEDVMKALDQGEPKPVKFPKLEKLLKNHMPDTDEPEIMPKQSEAETRKLHGPIDSLKQGSNKSEFTNEIDENETGEHAQEKKVDEAREICSECGSYMEEGHACDEDSKEQLEEWANDQGRHGTDEAQLMNTEFMTRTISGGLNGQKRDQTTLPHTEVKIRAGDDLGDWLRLSGLR